jgi:hypothetical protein
VIVYLNSVTQFIFVMVKCGVLFEVRTEFVNIVKTSLGFEGLKQVYVHLGQLILNEMLF